MKRLFLAVVLPDANRAAVSALVHLLQSRITGVKWTHSGNMHLTLKFLGNTPDGQVHAVVNAAREAVSRFSVFRVSVRGLAAFPSAAKPRIIWVGVRSEESGKLEELAALLDRTMTNLGFEPEKRPFTPHVTIGRARRGAIVPGLHPYIERFDAELGPPFLVEQVVLFESKLTPSGPIYTQLAAFELALHG